MKLSQGEIAFVLPRAEAPTSSSSLSKIHHHHHGSKNTKKPQKFVPYLFPLQLKKLQEQQNRNEGGGSKSSSNDQQQLLLQGETTRKNTNDQLSKELEHLVDSMLGVSNDKEQKSKKVEKKKKVKEVVQQLETAKESTQNNTKAIDETTATTASTSASAPLSPTRKSLVRTVDEAKTYGRRPRANSTDHELNLPQHGLCDEHIVLQSHKWDMDTLYMNKGLPPPRGLQNLGNTCFLNATLQCLAYMPSFCQSITAIPTECYGIGSGNNSKIHRGQRITILLRLLLRRAHGIVKLEQNKEPLRKPIAPREIHKAITSCKTIGHRFRPGRQEDAHELLVHLLDSMHEGELMAAGINPNTSGWRDALPIPRLDETTFVHRIFGGYFRSQLKCNNCNYKSNTYDPFLDLALEVSKKHINSLVAAFKEFTRKEKLDSNNCWKCSGCKKKVCPTKHLSVFRPPLSLCIHLKRFGFGTGMGKQFHGGMGWGGHRHGKGLSMMGNGGSKIAKKIDFPAQLSLPLSDGRVCQYLLTGVIIHVGSSATSGHYLSFVKQPGSSKKWYCMDDSHVEVVSESTVLKQRDAYVLFYTRKEVKLEFPQPPPREPEERSKNAGNDSPKSMSSVDNISPKSDLDAISCAHDASHDEATPVKNGKGFADVKRSLSYKQNKKNSLKKGKKKGSGKAWKPRDGVKTDSEVESTLLGNIAVGDWNDSGGKGSKNSKKNKRLRLSAAEQMGSIAKSKKRKMRTSHWDSLIDEAKQPKKKAKTAW